MVTTLRRVDFLGVPGVGKTTLYRSLVHNRRSGEKPWLTVNEAKFLVAARSAWQMGLRGKIDALRLRVPGFRGGLVASYARRAATKALADKPQEWDVLLLHGGLDWDVLMDLYQRAAGEPPRCADGSTATLLQSLHITRSAPDIAMLRAMPGRTPVLFDNSLTQRVCEAACLGPEPLQVVRRCAENLPPPAGLLYMRASVDETVQRLESRQLSRYGCDQEGRISLLYHRMGHDDVHDFVSTMILALNEAVRILESLGTPTLYLDPEHPLDTQIERVARFVSSLHETSFGSKPLPASD